MRLRLYGPDGDLWKEVDGPGGRRVEERLSLVTESPGGCLLEIAPRPGEKGSGGYELVWEELRSAKPRDRFRIEAENHHHRGRHLRQLPSREQRLEALAAFGRALALWKEAEDLDGEAGSLDQMGGVHLDLGEAREGLGHFQAALPLYLASGNLAGQANVHNNIGIALDRLGEPREALEHYQRALVLWSEVGDERGEAMTLDSVGGLYVSARELKAAHDAFERALTLRRAAGDLRGEAVTLSNMGFVYRRLGEVEKTLRCYRRALEIARQLENRGHEVVFLFNLGSVYHTQGELQAALDAYHEALGVSRALGDRRVEQRALSQLGLAYRDLGEPRRALEHLAAALELARKMESRRDEARSLMNLGWVYDTLHQPEEAVEHFNLALEKSAGPRAGTTELNARRGLGRSYRRLGRLTDAVNELDRALELSRELAHPLGQLDALHELGQTHLALGRPAQARDLFHRSLELTRALEVPIREAMIHAGLARAHQDLGQLTEARTEIEKALRIYSSLRAKVASPNLRAAFRSGRYEDYELHIDLLMTLHRLHPEKGHGVEAFTASESARARSLVEHLAEAGIEVSEGISPELKERERATGRRLSWIQGRLIRELSKDKRDAERLESLRTQLEKAREEREEVERETRRRHPRYAGVHYPRPLGLGEVQEILPERTALLEYALGEEASFLFAVTRATFAAFQLVPAGEIGELVEQVRAATSQPGRRSRGRFLQASQRLYERLIGPAAGSLANVDRLLIVPDRELYYLPFEALLRGPEDYLLDRWAVAYTPSATVLASLARRGSATDGPWAAAFVGFAEPAFGAEDPEPGAAPEGASALATRGLAERLEGWRLRPLPASGDEVRAVAALFGPEKTRIYLRDEAGEENVKANPLLETSRRIHFATHGILDDREPAYSGLLLTTDPKTQEDGLLQVHEIFNLRIAADLVVLSACETGVGKQVRGEGIIGLSRAFMYAGAPSLVVSLWQVADQSTAELMLRFYRHLNGGADKIEALRQAKRELMGDGRYSHPFYWAPFILMGRPD